MSNRRKRYREPMPPGDGWKLRTWRDKNNVPREHVEQVLEVSTATLYRIESGYPPPLDLANRICALTRGAVRYRDLYHSFHPEYA